MTAERELKRGEVYVGDPDPVVGHEQGGRRPYLLISIDPVHDSPAALAIAVPLTTTDRGNRLHVRVEPPEGGLERVSYAMPEMVRSISVDRLGRRLGRVSLDSVEAVARHTGLLIGLGRSR